MEKISPKTILIHSFSKGVGRSNLAANLAYLTAAKGQRVGIIDTDTLSPTLHGLFGLDEESLKYTFNDYLHGNCDIEQAAYNISLNLNIGVKGQLFLVPANVHLGKKRRELSRSDDTQLLNSGCKRLIDHLNLDALFIDTHPGVGEEALVSIIIADLLVVILRLNPGDYQGTGVALDVVRQLDVPQVVLIVNEAPTTFDFTKIQKEVEEAYKSEVVAVLPHVDELMALANADIFVKRYPNHPVTNMLSRAVAKLVA